MPSPVAGHTGTVTHFGDAGGGRHTCHVTPRKAAPVAGPSGRVTQYSIAGGGRHDRPVPRTLPAPIAGHSTLVTHVWHAGGGASGPIDQIRHVTHVEAVGRAGADGGAAR